MGGAVGIAAVSAIAATSAGNYADAHSLSASSAVSLAHGFQTGLYVLTGLLLVAVLVAFTLVRSAVPQPVVERLEGSLDELKLHLRGVELVHQLREQRGAGAEELQVYSAEIDRTRRQLADAVGVAA
jgi:hypothetical protein